MLIPHNPKSEKHPYESHVKSRFFSSFFQGGSLKVQYVFEFRVLLKSMSADSADPGGLYGIDPVDPVFLYRDKILKKF